jgi:radical SAM superfamily enzyme YgiQ (UPF0313 family)
MKKVLLIQPPLEDFYTTPIRLYPLGLTYVASLFERAGLTTAILDCLVPLKKRQLAVPDCFGYLRSYLNDNPYLYKGYYRFGRTDNAIFCEIDRFSPDLIGISSQFTAYFETVALLVSQITERYATPVFLGGNHATVFAEQIRRRLPCVEDVLTGPAEDSIHRFLQRFGYSVRGTDWRFVFPAHHLLVKDGYRIGRKNYMSLIASRGCPYRCDFCSVHSMFGRKIVYRSVKHVLEEMVWNYLRRDVRIFNFEDDNLSFDRQWFSGFLRTVIRDPVLRDIELTAMNGLCYLNLDRRVLSLMRQAGFKRLDLSYVTGDSSLRKRFNRPDPRRELDHIVRYAKDLDFFITVYLIIGLPGQTFAEVEKTIEYLFDLGVLVGPSVFYIPPGSPMFSALSLPAKTIDEWNLYRSSAFAVETELLNRDRLVELFTYARKKNLSRRGG